MVKNFDELIQIAKNSKKMKLAVAGASDAEVLLAVDNAKKMGFIDGILFGEIQKIMEIADACNINLSDYELVNVKDGVEISRSAVSYVSSGRADFVMKGSLTTANLLRAVLDKEIGLRTNNLLSHVMIYSVPTYHKLVFLTDGGMVTYPDLQQKVQIIQNAVKVAKALGISPVNVAPLCAVEVVNTDMQATIDAAVLSKMKQYRSDKW